MAVLSRTGSDTRRVRSARVPMRGPARVGAHRKNAASPARPSEPVSSLVHTPASRPIAVEPKPETSTPDRYRAASRFRRTPAPPHATAGTVDGGGPPEEDLRGSVAGTGDAVVRQPSRTPCSRSASAAGW